MEWGPTKSNDWLMTFLLSFFQSVIVVQPIKVSFSNFNMRTISSFLLGQHDCNGSIFAWCYEELSLLIFMAITGEFIIYSVCLSQQSVEKKFLESIQGND